MSLYSRWVALEWRTKVTWRLKHVTSMHCVVRRGEHIFLCLSLELGESANTKFQVQPYVSYLCKVPIASMNNSISKCKDASRNKISSHEFLLICGLCIDNWMILCMHYILMISSMGCIKTTVLYQQYQLCISLILSTRCQWTKTSSLTIPSHTCIGACVDALRAWSRLPKRRLTSKTPYSAIQAARMLHTDSG